MSLIILQVDTPSIREYADKAAWSKQEYAGRHRQQFRRYTLFPDPACHPAWMKAKVLWTELCKAKDGQWFWQTDADLFITNMTVKPFIPKVGDASELLIGADENGINSGSFYIKATEATRKMMEKVWTERYGHDNPFVEQSAIARHLTEVEYDLIDRVADGFNVYPREWLPSSLTIHLPGQWHDHRTKVDELYLDYTVRS